MQSIFVLTCVTISRDMSLLKKLNSLANSTKEKAKTAAATSNVPDKPSSISNSPSNASSATSPAPAVLPNIEALKIAEKPAPPTQANAPAPVAAVHQPPKLQIADFVIDRTLGTHLHYTTNNNRYHSLLPFIL